MIVLLEGQEAARACNAGAGKRALSSVFLPKGQAARGHRRNLAIARLSAKAPSRQA
jgi:hypothetical protein